MHRRHGVGRAHIDNRSCGTEARGVSFQRTALDKSQHFTVTNAGRKCLEWTREAGEEAFIAVGETGTYRLTMAQEVICPDGKKHQLEADGCATNLPGGVHESSPFVQLTLRGLDQPVFRCDFVDGTFRDAAAGG